MSEPHTKTSKEVVERIAGLLSPAGTIRTRNMMGGYLVYLDEVLIGQINNSNLYIKITSSGKNLGKSLTKEEPYPGAKPAFVVSEKNLKTQSGSSTFLKVLSRN